MRTYALALIVMLLAAPAFAQMHSVPAVAPEYVARTGDDLYTLAEKNRAVAQSDGREEMALTWQQVKSLNPHLRDLPVVYRHGRPYVYFPVGTVIEGLPFLVSRLSSASPVSRIPDEQAEMAARASGVPAGLLQNVYVLGAIGVTALTLLVLLMVYMQRHILPGIFEEAAAESDPEAEPAVIPTVQPAAEPPSPQFPTREAYEQFRTRVLLRNPRDPEHMGPGFRLPTAPPATLEEHLLTSATLAIRQRHNVRRRQIVSVDVAGGEWPTEFYTSQPGASDIRIAEPRGHTLVVGIYFDDEGKAIGYTLHWQFCLNGVPFGMLSERERHFIGEGTTFGNLKVLRNDSGFPDIALEDLIDGLRERFGVREWPDDEEPGPGAKPAPAARPRPVLVERKEPAPREPEEDFSDSISYALVPRGKFARGKKAKAPCGNVRLVLTVRKERYEFDDRCTVFVPFSTGIPRASTPQKFAHLRHGVTFLIRGGTLTVARGPVIVEEGLPVGSSDRLAFPREARSTRNALRPRNARRREAARAAAA